MKPKRVPPSTPIKRRKTAPPPVTSPPRPLPPPVPVFVEGREPERFTVHMTLRMTPETRDRLARAARLGPLWGGYRVDSTAVVRRAVLEWLDAHLPDPEETP